MAAGDDERGTEDAEDVDARSDPDDAEPPLKGGVACLVGGCRHGSRARGLCGEERWAEGLAHRRERFRRGCDSWDRTAHTERGRGARTARRAGVTLARRWSAVSKRGAQRVLAVV